MEIITVAQYWNGDVSLDSTEYAEKYQIYCFWHGDTCLYIGRTANMNRR